MRELCYLSTSEILKAIDLLTELSLKINLQIVVKHIITSVRTINHTVVRCDLKDAKAIAEILNKNGINMWNDEKTEMSKIVDEVQPEQHSE